MLTRFAAALLVLAGCATANADPIPETYSAFLYWSPTNFAYATYTDRAGFINSEFWATCSELSSYRFVYESHPVSCEAGVFFAPVQGGLSVFIESAQDGLAGGFFVPPNQDGTFFVYPYLPSYLKISALPTAVATPEPNNFILVILCVSLLFAIKKRFRF